VGYEGRLERRRTLHRIKEKFGPRWEERHLVVPGRSTLPEILVALVRGHVPPLPAAAAWLRSCLFPERTEGGRRAVA